MKKLNFCFVFLIIAICSFSAFAQNSIYRPCPGSTVQAKVEIDKQGNINLVPCPTRTYLFNGQPLNLNAIGQLNGLNGYSQTFAFGSAGTSPGWVSSGTTHTLNIPTASATNTGLMTPTMFNKYETAAAGYVGLSTNFVPLWNGSTFNNSQFSQTGAGYASVLRANGQTVCLGDCLAAGNNRTVTISDINSNTLSVIGASNFNGNLTVNGNITATSFTLGSQSANTFYAAPSSGGGVPSFRTIVAADIPVLDAAKITTGNFSLARLGTGTANNSTYLRGDGTWASLPTSGTVTSVGLTLPNIFTVSNSPVTTSGSLTATLASQTQRQVFAAPTGGNGAPVFRALEAADIGSGVFAPARLGTGTANSSTYLRGDGTWASSAPRVIAYAPYSTGNTVSASDSGSIYVGYVYTTTLPAGVAGMVYTFGHPVTSGGATINFAVASTFYVGDGGTQLCSSLTLQGGSVTLVHDGSVWSPINKTGTVTCNA